MLHWLPLTFSGHNSFVHIHLPQGLVLLCLVLHVVISTRAGQVVDQCHCDSQFEPVKMRTYGKGGEESSHSSWRRYVHQINLELGASIGTARMPTEIHNQAQILPDARHKSSQHHLD